MRKKLLSTTYLRDVRKYEIKFDINNDDYFLCIKHFFDCDPFIVSDGTTLMDNGYYMIELAPKNENYSMRVYLNEKKEILQYYYDVSLGNGLDPETKIPYYDDLYVDVTYANGKIDVLDENELLEAYESDLITKEDYDLALRVRDKLVSELKSDTNKYKNMNLKELL